VERGFLPSYFSVLNRFPQMPIYDYAELITQKPVKRFLQRFCLTDEPFESLIIVSPWIGTLEGTRFTLAYMLTLVEKRRLPTYVITREPTEEWHEQAVNMLKACNWVEIRYNPSLHAKLYVGTQSEGRGFAMLGSGNLSRTSIERNIEIGMMIYGRGRGRGLLHELAAWGTIRLRTQSKLVKKMQRKRRL